MAPPFNKGPPLKRYILAHEGRRGLTLYRFESKRDMTAFPRFTVHEDITDEQRSLLLFLSITLEYNDYIILYEDPVSQGEWT
jgi:hypothetical protein